MGKLDGRRMYQELHEMVEREMSGKNKETEMLRASLMKKVSELNDNEIISLYDDLSETFKTKRNENTNARTD